MILSKQRKIQTTIHRKTIFAILLGGIFLMPLISGIRIVQSKEDIPAEQTVENQKAEAEKEFTDKAPQGAKIELNESVGKAVIQAPKFRSVQPPKFKVVQSPKFKLAHPPEFKFNGMRVQPPKFQILGDVTPMAPINFNLNQLHEMDAAEAEKLSEELSKQAREINKLAAELAKKQSEVAQQLEVTLAQNKELMEKLTEMQKQLESTLKDEMWKKQLEKSDGEMQDQLEQALKILESSNKIRSELHVNQALQAMKSSGGKMQKQLELALQALENFDKIQWERVKMESKIEVALQTYVGSPEDILKRGNIAEGVLRLRKSADSLESLRYYTIGYVKSLRAMYLALNYMEQPGLILKLPPQVGTEWTDRVYVDGIEGHTAVESTTEKVETPAGAFENCLKLRTTITGVTKEDKPSDAFLRGTRTMYFAPGVGLVKLEYQHETGHHTEIVLVDYVIQRGDINTHNSARSTDYFPLDVDDTWTYRWEDGYFDKGESFTEVWTVKEQEEDVYTIHCAMRRPPGE